MYFELCYYELCILNYNYEYFELCYCVIMCILNCNYHKKSGSANRSLLDGRSKVMKAAYDQNPNLRRVFNNAGNLN